jgi:(p)ppGpp synthase/HD superfamily hydrolase
MMSIKEFAKNLSHVLHANQYRNDGKTPYTVHTDYVGDNAVRFYKGDSCATDLVHAVGYLHDAIEDQVTYEELLSFGKDYGNGWKFVVDAVKTLSRESKSTSIITYLTNIALSDVTTAVKLTDLEHNMSDLKPGNLRDKYELCRNFLIRVNE